MKAYEVIVDGEVIFATVDESLAKGTTAKWNKHGHLATYREQVVPTELSDLVSLCHQMNIERARGRGGAAWNAMFSPRSWRSAASASPDATPQHPRRLGGRRGSGEFRYSSTGDLQ